MKINMFYCFAILLASLLPFSENTAQNGKGLVFDGENQFVQFQATNFPAGNSTRTLEFWVRAVPKTDGITYHIINWGQMGASGSSFGVFLRYIEGKYSFGFWGHNQDFQSLATLPDNQWHFVALSYDGGRLRFFLDGELKAIHSVSLNTSVGDVSIASRAKYPHYLEGAVRDIAVWRTARNQKQIQMDMAGWPTLTGNESELAAYLPLNEGTGNTFSDKKNVIRGTINGKATWSKPIPDDPNPTDEGTWFVIQNKADLDTDTDIKARRMALSVNGGNIVWAAIPLTGDYDAFLWRTVAINGGYHLVNKKLGLAKALDCSQENPVIGNYGLYSGQNWTIQPANLQDWGTNVYTLSNNFITANKALSLEGNQVRVTAKDAVQTKQAWVLQPMELAIGYHIPVSASGSGPMTQALNLTNGIKVYASNTVRDWSVLTAHLIWKNMLNALNNPNAITRMNGSTFTRKELQIISRFDQNRIVADYPLNMASNQLIFNEDWFTNYRGGSGNDPNRKLSSTTITEEMMCQNGVFSRGYNDRSFREFDQTIHEFGHALDYMCGMDGRNFPDPTLYDSKVEAIAAAIQTWFNNNNSYNIFARTRAQQRIQQPNHYNRLKEFFRESNTWMPPRWLRNQPDGRVELKDGETLQIGEWIYSTTPYSPNGTYAVLQEDGNFVIYTNDGNGFKWGSYNNISVPLSRVKTLKMENGILRMKDASGNNVYSSDNSPCSGCRLIVAEPLPGKPNSWIRIVDANKTLIWNP